MKYCNTEFVSDNPDYLDIFKLWSFPLSEFQKWAIYSIHKGYDTLVCAPTGSGKTLPAEFAITYYHNKGKKIIYTTPIKALSNEKFYTLSKQFPNISFGLLTGDNKFNPEADVIIMTTEILLNTLKKMKTIEKTKSNDNISLDFEINMETELGTVIFDEIHYINDADRGSVWEESIMFLPKQVSYIGLSATINSPESLCNWSESYVGAQRGEIYLCYSNHRNVPLEHYSFMSIPDSYFKKMKLENINMLQPILNKPVLLKKQNNYFDEKKYNYIQKALKYINNNNIECNKFYIFNKMLEYLYRNHLFPALTFIFSRKQCHIWANKINFTLFENGSLVPSIIEKKATQILINKLSNWKEYVFLPEFKNIIKLLKKGIAVHHSGVTPVFREMIELLYGEAYIKLLIATETFAVGINMGIKSVIFTGLQKFDGRGFRYLHSHEYGQAAGRAGRRGKDIKGYVFHLNNIFNSTNTNPDADTYRKILSGKPLSLRSKFKIDFKIILSLLYSNTPNLVRFISSSMLQNEINNAATAIEEEQNQIKQKIELLSDHINASRTHIDTLKKYDDLLITKSLVFGKKKRKERARQLSNMSNLHPNLLIDYELFLKRKKLLDLYESLENQNTANTIYISSEISLHMQLLRENDFIEQNEEDHYTGKLLIKGQIAANIHEIHSLAVSDLLVNKDLDNLTVEELVSVLSIFTNIRLNDEDKYTNVEYCNVNKNIIHTVKKIVMYLDKYYDMETKHKTNFSQSYDIQYDMCEFMYKWCFSENETDCRNIYNEAKKYNIYVGEFIKAILKINKICSELESVCEIQNNIKLLHTLNCVKEKTLKSIATNQSLYL